MPTAGLATRTRIPSPRRAVACCGVVVALCAGASPAADPGAEDPRSFVYPQVQRIYDAGGEKALKDWMKRLVKDAKKAKLRLASGSKPKCGSCHDSLKTYTQLPNALSDLGALLAWRDSREGS